jgi:hypothetical protein
LGCPTLTDSRVPTACASGDELTVPRVPATAPRRGGGAIEALSSAPAAGVAAGARFATVRRSPCSPRSPPERRPLRSTPPRRRAPRPPPEPCAECAWPPKIFPRPIERRYRRPTRALRPAPSRPARVRARATTLTPVGPEQAPHHDPPARPRQPKPAPVGDADRDATRARPGGALIRLRCPPTR